MSTDTQIRRTVVQVVESRQSELLETWIENIRSLPGNRTVELMGEDQLRTEATGLLRALTTAFGCEVYDDIEQPEMAEEGVDISGHRSKRVDELSDVAFDYVVTLCGNARETCPVFPGRTKVVHVGFADPPRLAEGAASEDEALGHYRRVRDEIRAFVETLPEALVSRRQNA